MKDIAILDACALIALLKNEKGAEKIAAVYNSAATGKCKLIMNRINLLEVYYGFYHDEGKEYASKIVDNVAQSLVAISDKLLVL